MIILPFGSAEATLEMAGGKGMNLARLTRTGFAVPPGFIISTNAYREFVDANRWLPTILSGVADLSAADAGAMERASSQIRVAFTAGKMPEELEAAIRAPYADLKNKPIAVRSSATAEDLPDLSFAGQQDTYLNVIGAEQLLEAVVNCWSSLWTARAIVYRIRNHVDHHEAALAVIVQEMVQSEASGVLFTANPLTGMRSESVIDATLGLGEALVSGQVEPDHYVVDTLNSRILAKTLGAKKISTRGKTGGGVEVIEEEAESKQALSDAEIQELAAVGQQIQKEYGSPQDIEWAFAEKKLYILQSRAITSLYPLPNESIDPLVIWFSFGSVQGILGAITPLGQMPSAWHLAGPENYSARRSVTIKMKSSCLPASGCGSRSVICCAIQSAPGFMKPSSDLESPVSVRSCGDWQRNRGLARGRAMLGSARSELCLAFFFRSWGALRSICTTHKKPGQHFSLILRASFMIPRSREKINLHAWRNVSSLCRSTYPQPYIAYCRVSSRCLVLS